MLSSRVINEHPIRLATPAIRRSNGSVSAGSKRACSMSSQISGSMINDPVSWTRVFHSGNDRGERNLLLSNSKSNSKKADGGDIDGCLSFLSTGERFQGVRSQTPGLPNRIKYKRVSVCNIVHFRANTRAKSSDDR